MQNANFDTNPFENNQNKTIGETVELIQNLFKVSGIPEARISAEILISQSIKKNRSYLKAHSTDIFVPNKAKTLFDWVRRRLNREPLAYIIGKREFYSLEFIVTKDTLIPRPETELLVDFCLENIKGIPSPSILDLGTGSGCIAVSIAVNAQQANVVASDISLKAIDIAKQNSKALSVDNPVQYIQSDLLTAFCDNSFDVIVSNLPYIGESEKSSLEPEVLEWEPNTALFADDDGFDCFNKTVPNALNILKCKGFLALELGYKQAETVKTMMISSGFTNVIIKPDYANIPRIVIGYKL